MSLIEEVKKVLIGELNIDTIEDTAKQEDYSEWDSLTYMRIVAAIENNFGIEITADNINNFNSVANIVQEIEKKQ